MVSLTIGNVDETLESRLRARAAHHGRSMEEEARQILREALGEGPGEQAVPVNLADLAESLFGVNGVELAPHPPVQTREPPDFGS